jgi:hypothetical protein
MSTEYLSQHYANRNGREIISRNGPCKGASQKKVCVCQRRWFACCQGPRGDGSLDLCATIRCSPGWQCNGCRDGRAVARLANSLGAVPTTLAGSHARDGRSPSSAGLAGNRDGSPWGPSQHRVGCQVASFWGWPGMLGRRTRGVNGPRQGAREPQQLPLHDCRVSPDAGARLLW